MSEELLESYPWYISDWRGSKMRLKLSSCGRSLFRELLDYCWEVGSLPTDERTLIAISGGTKAEFKKEWPIMQAAFFEKDGSFRHRKVEDRRPKLLHFRESRRINASAPRKAKAIANQVATAKGHPSLLLTSSVLPSEAITAAAAREPEFAPFEEFDPEREIGQMVEQLARVWVCPGSIPRAKMAAQHEWSKSETHVVEWVGTVTASASLWLKYHQALRSKNGNAFVPFIERWFTDGDYSRPAPEAVAPAKRTGRYELAEDDNGAQ